MLQRRTWVRRYAWIWYFMSRTKTQYIVTPRSAPEYRKYDICQPFTTEIWRDIFWIHSHPQIHISPYCVTPGDVHFSLGLNRNWNFPEQHSVPNVCITPLPQARGTSWPLVWSSCRDECASIYAKAWRLRYKIKLQWHRSKSRSNQRHNILSREHIVW